MMMMMMMMMTRQHRNYYFNILTNKCDYAKGLYCSKLYIILQINSLDPENSFPFIPLNFHIIEKCSK